MLVSLNLLAKNPFSLNEAATNYSVWERKPVLALGVLMLCSKCFIKVEWGRNQLPSDLQDARNISQRNKFSFYLYTAWPHFSRISWIHKLGSSSLSPELYRFSLVALSFCGHAVLDWLSSLLCHSGQSSCFSPFSLSGGQHCEKEDHPSPCYLSQLLSDTNLISFSFQSTASSELSSSRYNLNSFMSFYFFCKLSICHRIALSSPAFWCHSFFSH